MIIQHKQRILATVLSVVVSSFLVVGFAFAVSTIGTSITTDGDLTINGNTVLGNSTALDLVTITGTIQGASPFVFEGLTANDFETTFAITDPTTPDKTITFPDLTGTVVLSGHTFTGDVTATLGASNTTALTIAADSVALVTDTTGNFVAAVTTSALTGLTGGNTAAENTTSALAFDYTATLAASPALAASACVFATTGLICEGATADAIETLLTFADPAGADVTITFPAVTGTVITTGDTATVTSLMIAVDTIVAADIATDAVATAEILDNTVTATDLNAVLTFADADLVDLGAILHNDAAEQGLRLPNVGASPADITGTNEGYIGWDQSGNRLLVNDGATWSAIGPGAASNNTWTGTNTYQTDVDFTFLGAENFAITNDASATVDVISLAITPSGTVGTIQGIKIDNVDSANANGLDVGIEIDNSDITGSDMADGILFTSAGGVITDAIDATDTDIVNAINVGTNVIAITTGTIGSNDASIIDFVDFDVSADGLVVFASDGAGDQITMTSPAADWQAIVIDAATADSTNATGLIQLTMDTVTASANALSIDFQVNDAGASSTYIADELLVTIDLDAAQTPTVYGKYVSLTVNEDTAVTYGIAVEQQAATDLVTAGILVDNLDADDAMTSGILLRAAAGAMTTAIDASDAEIGTALSIGANTIDATELDFNIAPTGSASSIAITASVDAEDFLIDLIGAFNTSLTLRSAGNSTDALVLSTTAGGMDITVAGNLDTEDLDITATGVTTEIRVATASTVADAFRLNASAGGIDIDATNSTLTISNTADGDGDDLTIEVLGAFTGTLVLASAGTGADALTITTTAGGIDIVNGGAAGGEDLDMSSTLASVNITAGESAVDSIVISSTIGGIDITAAGAAAGEDIDITATGSSVNISATENVADAIYLRANGGISETLRLHADQGTGYASIQLISDVGGIRFGAGIGVTIGGASATDTTAANVTYTVAQFCGSLILRDPTGASRSDTTPTAAALIAACIPTAGDKHTVLLRNTADAAEVITVLAGTTVVLVGEDAGADLIGQNELGLITFWNIDGTTVVMEIEDLIDAD